MLMSGFSAFLASLGFGVIFNVKGKYLLVAAICGGIGGFTYALACAYYSETIALMIGSICLSFASEVVARTMKSPVTTFLVCALIPLVPGGGMYNTMIELVKGDVFQALVTCAQTVIDAGSIALGCTLVSSLMRLVFKTKVRKETWL